MCWHGSSQYERDCISQYGPMSGLLWRKENLSWIMQTNLLLLTPEQQEVAKKSCYILLNLQTWIFVKFWSTYTWWIIWMKWLKIVMISCTSFVIRILKNHKQDPSKESKWRQWPCCTVGFSNTFIVSNWKVSVDQQIDNLTSSLFLICWKLPP